MSKENPAKIILHIQEEMRTIVVKTATLLFSYLLYLLVMGIVLHFYEKLKILKQSTGEDEQLRKERFSGEEEEMDNYEERNCTLNARDKNVAILEEAMPPVLDTVSVGSLCVPESVSGELEEDVPMLKTIAACVKVQLQTAEQGQFCLVSDPQDKLFYRARVTSTISPPCDDTNTSNDVTTLYALQYVDYGNRETLPITSLYAIPLEVTQHKVCGIPAKLAATKIPAEDLVHRKQKRKRRKGNKPLTKLRGGKENGDGVIVSSAG